MIICESFLDPIPIRIEFINCKLTAISILDKKVNSGRLFFVFFCKPPKVKFGFRQ